jgi:hypothetical protein
MRWSGDAEEALARLLEDHDSHGKSARERRVRERVESLSRREAIEEIDAPMVISAFIREADPSDRERIRKVIRALGLRPETFAEDLGS